MFTTVITEHALSFPTDGTIESCIDFRAAAHVREYFHQQRVRLSAVDNVRRFHSIRESRHTTIHLIWPIDNAHQTYACVCVCVYKCQTR